MQARNIEIITSTVAKEIRDIMTNVPKRTIIEDEKHVCRLDAEMNSGNCKAC